MANFVYPKINSAGINGSVASSTVPGVGESGTNQIESVVSPNFGAVTGETKHLGFEGAGGRMELVDSAGGTAIILENGKTQIHIDPSGHLNISSSSGSGISLTSSAG